MSDREQLLCFKCKPVPSEKIKLTNLKNHFFQAWWYKYKVPLV